MSGHSHWATIKHKKDAADAKRSNQFARIAKEITVAAKAGADSEANPRLRTVIEKARDVNMPTDNIERAIKRAGGEGGRQLEELLIEAYGPGGMALLVACITDNKNRTLGEIKQVLSKNSGKFVEGGAVQWMFERKGVLIAQGEGKPKEEFELLAIEAGAQDIFWQDSYLEIHTAPEQLEQTKVNLKKQGIVLESASLDWVAKETISLSLEDKEKTEKLMEALDNYDDVQDFYSNLA